MNKILKMNPLDYEHKIRVGKACYFITNAEIFNYCRSLGLDLDDLDNLTPTDGSPGHVGNMYGLILYINRQGEFHLKTSPGDAVNVDAIGSYDVESFDPNATIDLPQEYYEEDDEDEDKCDHEDFLVFDPDEKGNKFWCKICDERFPKHPQDIAAEKNPPKIVTPSSDMSEALERFTSGMITLSDIAKEFGIACETLSETIKNTFVERPIYQDQYVLGQLAPVGKVCVSVEPARQSDPLEIERFFEDMSLHAPEVQAQMMNKFPDIVKVDVNHDVEPFVRPSTLQKFTPSNDNFYYEILFIDDSVQKVYPKWGNK